MFGTNTSGLKCDVPPETEVVSQSIREQLEVDLKRRFAESNAALQKHKRHLIAERVALDQRSQSVQSEITRRLELERKRLTNNGNGETEAKLGSKIKNAQAQVKSQRLRLQQSQDTNLIHKASPVMRLYLIFELSTSKHRDIAIPRPITQ